MEALRKKELEKKELEKRFPLYYMVKKGDNLFKIAYQENIYHDPYQWPLIYKANRDQIRDPHLIYAGQKLVIPRPLSIEKIEGTRKEGGANSPSQGHTPSKAK